MRRLITVPRPKRVYPILDDEPERYGRTFIPIDRERVKELSRENDIKRIKRNVKPTR